MIQNIFLLLFVHTHNLLEVRSTQTYTEINSSIQGLCRKTKSKDSSTVFAATQAAAQSSKCARIQGNCNLKTLLLLKVLPCKLYALSDEFFM